MQRSGVLARKVGMTRLLKESGESVAVTVLDLENCQVLETRAAEGDATAVVLLGIGQPKAKSVTKPMAGQFRKLQVEPKRKLLEFKIEAVNAPEAGSFAQASHFAAGQFVDVTGISKGKGFAGVMKRHNFGGLRATHGVSISHRSHGSTGQRQDPGKVFKNKKMAGHLGQERITTQNIRVAAIDETRNLVFLAGSVPGSNGDYIVVRDAVKKVQKELPLSGGFRAGAVGATHAAAAPESAAASAAAEE